MWKKHVHPIADKMAQNLEIISKNFHFSTRRTRSIIYYLVLIVNPIDRILVCRKVLEIISRFCATLSAIGCQTRRQIDFIHHVS